MSYLKHVSRVSKSQRRAQMLPLQSIQVIDNWAPLTGPFWRCCSFSCLTDSVTTLDWMPRLRLGKKKRNTYCSVSLAKQNYQLQTGEAWKGNLYQISSIMSVSTQTKPSYKCSPLRPFHFTLQFLRTKICYSLPDQICRWGNPPVCLCQVFVQFLSLNFQVIQATLKSIYNKSSFGWQGFARTLWAFLIPMGLNGKKTHNLRRRNKFRDCFWAAERAGSILGVAQWEICLWDSGEE